MLENIELDGLVKSNFKASMAYTKGLAGKQKVAELNIAVMQIESFLKSTIFDEELDIGNKDLIKRFNKIKEFLCVD